MKRTDIIGTIGSSSESTEVLKRMIESGLTIARINMSHADHAEHDTQLENLAAAEQASKKHIKKLFDLAGPKIRVGEMEPGAELTEGELVTITTVECVGNKSRFFINYPKLPAEVSTGTIILLTDGKRRLEVLSTNGNDEIECVVRTGGLLSSRRGVNIPGAKLSIPAITEKDMRDIDYAILRGADMVALSFVRSVDDVRLCREILASKGSSAAIVSKIETVEATNDLRSIIKESDGVMVARGDLAVEIGFENVPPVQREIIRIARELGRFSIVATQVLDSMEKSPVPTRAEASDVFYAVTDGANAVMLSGETTIGDYPAKSVETVRKLSDRAEMWMSQNF